MAVGTHDITYWWKFMCQIDLSSLKVFMGHWHLLVSTINCAAYIYSIGLLTGIPDPVEGSAALKKKAAMIYGSITISAVLFFVVFGIILFKGIVHNQASYLKLWFRYYIIMWIENCINITYTVSCAELEAGSKVVLALALFLVCGLGMCVTFTSIMLEIQRQTEIQNMKEDTLDNASRRVMKPITTQISESTHLLTDF